MLFAEARDAAEGEGDVEQVVQCLAGLADIAYFRGRLDESSTLLSQALGLCQEQGDESGMAYCLWNLAYVSIWRGDEAEARTLLGRETQDELRLLADGQIRELLVRDFHARNRSRPVSTRLRRGSRAVSPAARRA